MKSTVLLFSIVMIICIIGMIYYAGDDRMFSIFSGVSLIVTLIGTYFITQKKDKESCD